MWFILSYHVVLSKVRYSFLIFDKDRDGRLGKGGDVQHLLSIVYGDKARSSDERVRE